MSDFVEVRLTKFRESLAAGTAVRVQEGVREFIFLPGQPHRVTVAFDWNRVLSRQLINGHRLFEIVPEEIEQQPKE
jgi:hypothetical protein